MKVNKQQKPQKSYRFLIGCGIFLLIIFAAKLLLDTQPIQNANDIEQQITTSQETHTAIKADPSKETEPTEFTVTRHTQIDDIANSVANTLPSLLLVLIILGLVGAVGFAIMAVISDFFRR